MGDGAFQVEVGLAEAEAEPALAESGAGLGHVQP